MSDVPAFPSTHGDLACQGMTLRDYFAAQAMQGMLSNFEWMQHAAQSSDMPGDAAVVLMSYEIADAMLKAREAKQ